MRRSQFLSPSAPIGPGPQHEEEVVVNDDEDGMEYFPDEEEVSLQTELERLINAENEQATKRPLLHAESSLHLQILEMQELALHLVNIEGRRFAGAAEPDQHRAANLSLPLGDSARAQMLEMHAKLLPLIRTAESLPGGYQTYADACAVWAAGLSILDADRGKGVNFVLARQVDLLAAGGHPAVNEDLLGIDRVVYTQIDNRDGVTSVNGAPEWTHSIGGDDLRRLASIPPPPVSVGDDA